MTVLPDASAVPDGPGGEFADGLMAAGALSVAYHAELLSHSPEGGMAIAAAVMVDRCEPRPLPFGARQASEPARARALTMRQGLALGDRACLGHALSQRLAIVTADRNWAKPDFGLELT